MTVKFAIQGLRQEVSNLYIFILYYLILPSNYSFSRKRLSLYYVFVFSSFDLISELSL